MLIRVGAPPKTAFNQDRPISDLIRSQVDHLKHVEERLTPEQRRTIPAGEIKTEAEAARYIAAMTAVLQSGARVEEAAERAPKVESIRRPLKTGKKRVTKAPAASSKLALAASATGSKKKSATHSKKTTKETKKTVSRAKTKTRGRATKKAVATKTETSRSRKKR